MAGRLQVSEKATVQLLKSNATMFACSLLWYFNVNVNYKCFFLNFIVIGLYSFFSGARYASVTVIVLGLSLSLVHTMCDKTVAPSVVLSDVEMVYLTDILYCLTTNPATVHEPTNFVKCSSSKCLTIRHSVSCCLIHGDA